jgi:hypothetical protein
MTMKYLAHVLLVVTLVVVGCQKPDAVVVNPDNESAAGFELTNLSSVDTNFVATSSVDSTGLFPEDTKKFTSFLLLNSVKYDAGNGVSGVTYSTAYFGDHDRPFVMNGHTYGYYEYDPDPIMHRGWTLNGLPMDRRPYRIHVPSASSGPAGDTTLGYYYVRVLANYRPNSYYTWRSGFSFAVVDSSGFSVKSPDDLQVLSPAGGSILSREKQLELRWTGEGSLDIVISVIDPSFSPANTTGIKPLLNLHPKVNTGRAILESRILQLLPKGRFFVFTFILRSRDERQPVVGSFSGGILIQAASLYNSYVQLE